MHIILYGVIALAGWCIGYALGSSWSSWILAPCVAVASVCAFTLAKTPHLALPSLFATKSIAHRAWFSSSWATLAVIIIVWLAVGWGLPGLDIGGLRLDPAGALGWTPDWLAPRQQLVLALLLAGFVGMIIAVVSWLWQKRAGKKPVVVMLWALGPFFWMSALGLLVGITQPWRLAPNHEIATQWGSGVSGERLPELADLALKEAEKDATAGVWAHALGLRAYQSGAWSRQQLDGFMQVLAQHNHKRSTVPVLPASNLVGVERQYLCVVSAKHAGKQKDVAIQGQCVREPLGRAWAWHSKD